MLRIDGEDLRARLRCGRREQWPGHDQRLLVRKSELFPAFGRSKGIRKPCSANNPVKDEVAMVGPEKGE